MLYCLCLQHVVNPDSERMRAVETPARSAVMQAKGSRFVTKIENRELAAAFFSEEAGLGAQCLAEVAGGGWAPHDKTSFGKCSKRAVGAHLLSLDNDGGVDKKAEASRSSKILS